MFSTDEYEAKMTGAFEHFGEELRKIRTGRAHPGMLAGVMVEAYGQSSGQRDSSRGANVARDTF